MLFVPLFTAKEIKTTKEGDLDPKGQAPFENSALATIFNVVRYLTFLGLYIGFGAVCVGVFKYEPPAGVWDGPLPPVSPAVACTMLLANTFFCIYLLLAISRTYSQYAGGQLFTSNFEVVMLRAADTLAMAPMLCVLFLAARMRALQMDPVSGNPQRSAWMHRRNSRHSGSRGVVLWRCRNWQSGRYTLRSAVGRARTSSSSPHS